MKVKGTKGAKEKWHFRRMHRLAPARVVGAGTKDGEPAGLWMVASAGHAGVSAMMKKRTSHKFRTDVATKLMRKQKELKFRKMTWDIKNSLGVKNYWGVWCQTYTAV